MIRFVYHPWSRKLSWLLVAALVLPLVMQCPAQAQSLRKLRQLRVVVLDIEDLTVRAPGEPPSEAVEQTALDAVYAALHANRHYHPVPTTDLERELESLQLSPPYVPVQQQQIARQLNADALVMGFIVTRGVVTEGDVRQAEVRLQLRMIDQLTGEPINGRTVKAQSRVVPGDTRSDQELIAEATKFAADKAVDAMSGYGIPQGAVISATDLSCIKINQGNRDGVHEGMTFVILRQVYDRGTEERTQEPVGHLVVERVFSTEAECKALDDVQTVVPEDVVRALWGEEPLASGIQVQPLPEGSGDSAKSSSSDVAEVLLGAALVGLVGVLVVRSVGTGVAGGRAVNTTGPVQIPNTNATQWTSIPVAGGEKPTPSVTLTWIEPSHAKTYVAGYEIHRGTLPGFAPTADTLQGIVAGPSTTTFVDDATEPAKMAMTVAPGATGMEFATTDATGPGLLDVSAERASYAWTQKPVEVGVRYFYVIRAITTGLDGGKAVADGGMHLDATRLYDLPAATAMVRPRLLQPAGMADSLADVMFRWEAVPGANTYVIEVSDTQSFAPERTVPSSPVTAAAGKDVVSSTFGGTSLVTNFSAESTLYWRVGVRSAASGTDYVYSDAAILAH